MKVILTNIFVTHWDNFALALSCATITHMSGILWFHILFAFHFLLLFFYREKIIKKILFVIRKLESCVNAKWNLINIFYIKFLSIKMQHICEHCPAKIFKTEYVLKSHMSWKHKQCICKKPCEPFEVNGVTLGCKKLSCFVCEHCNKVLTSRFNKDRHILKKHTMTHCDICHLDFMGTNYKKHIKFHSLILNVEQLDQKVDPLV